MPIIECLFCGINSEINYISPDFCDACAQKLEKLGVNLREAERILEEG